MKVIEQIVRLTVDGNETKAEVIGTLIRCADCIHYIDKGCEVLDSAMYPNDFCPYGERKDGEQDATD